MVGAILIHHRQPLGAAILGSGLGHIDDAAVEIGAFAGQPRIDGVGALVRGAAPLRGRDDEALAH